MTVGGLHTIEMKNGLLCKSLFQNGPNHIAQADQEQAAHINREGNSH